MVSSLFCLLDMERMVPIFEVLVHVGFLVADVGLKSNVFCLFILEREYFQSCKMIVFFFFW